MRPKPISLVKTERNGVTIQVRKYPKGLSTEVAFFELPTVVINVKGRKDLGHLVVSIDESLWNRARKVRYQGWTGTIIGGVVPGGVAVGPPHLKADPIIDTWLSSLKKKLH